MPGLIGLLPEPLAEGLRAWRAERRDRRDREAYRHAPVVPPPHAIKLDAILDHARRFGTRVLIETGTFEGEMTRKCAPHFQRIVTIELDPGYARRAAHRLRHHAHVTVLEGDSATRLADALRDLREPALFWLDGHYSGGLTARGSKDTPLLEELDTIARHGVSGHVVLVDDARCLGEGDYPTREELERRLRAIPGIERIELVADCVRATPRERPAT